MKRWKEYFEGLLKTETETSSNNEEERKMETDVTTDEEENDDITEEEVIKAINKTKSGVAAGHDKITNDMIKCLEIHE